MNDTINIIVALISLVSIAAILIGLVLCIPYRRRPQGKRIASFGGVLFVFVFSFALFHKPNKSSGLNTVEPSIQNAAVQAPAAPTYKEVLAQLRIGGLSWQKEGFGTIMKATFVVYNDSPVAVKDIVVTCKHSANSGTVIDSNTRTIYEIVGRKSYLSVVGANMGFIRSEIVQSKCAVTGYSQV